MIKAFLQDDQQHWDLNIGCLTAAYRATPHESTGFTPNLLMLGREVRLPAEVMFGSDTNRSIAVSSYGEYADKLRSRLQEAHFLTRKHLGSVAERQKGAYDAKLCLQRYKPGDLVWYRTEMGQLRTTPKLRHAFEGPFVIVKKINDLDYVLQFRPQGPRKVVHHDRLKKYEGDIRLRWAAKAVQAYQQ